MATDRVDFVDEDDARRVFLRLLEHVAHAAGADADEHLDEVRTGDGEERHAGFTRHGAGDQGLAGAGRTDQQGALGDLAAQALELGRVLEELDDFLQFFLGLVDAGDIVEHHAVLVLGQQSGLGLSEAHGALGAALHLTHEEDPHPDQQQDRQQVDHHAQRIDRVLLVDDLGAARLEALDQVVGVGRDIDAVRLARARLDLDHVAIDVGLLDVAAVDALEQLRVALLAAASAGFAALTEDGVGHDQHQHDCCPDAQGLEIHTRCLPNDSL